MGVAIIVPGADYRNLNIGQVTPTNVLPIQGLAIIGESNVFVTAKYTPAFFPTFTTERNVIWSIVNGSEYATISQDGVLIGTPQISGESVTIRCTSADNPTIYAEKTITVTTVQLIFKDWVMSDGTDAIYFPGLNDIWNAKVTLRCTQGGANTYVMCCMYALDSTQARIAAYNNSSNKVSAYAGTGGTNNWVTKSNIIYRYVWNLGASGATNSSAYLYNDETGVTLGSKTNVRITMSGRLGLFRYSVGAYNTGVWSGAPTSLTPNGAKIYGMTVERTSDNVMLMDLRPCLYSGIAGVYDMVTQTFWPGIVNEGGITVCDDE